MASLNSTIVTGNLNITGNISAENTISNPNLLINPDFKINQRGKTTYYGYDDDYFTVDHWALWDTYSYSGLDVNNNYIRWYSPNGWHNNEYTLLQPLEEQDYKKLMGKTVTISCELTDYNQGNICFRTNLASESEWTSSPQLHAGFNSFTFNVPTNLSNGRKLIGFNSTDAEHYGAPDVKIKWVKLELGGVATTFIPPLYNKEILKCKRYYVRYGYPNSTTATAFENALPFGLGVATSVNREVRFPIQYPVPMYRLPDIHFEGFGTFIRTNQNYIQESYSGNTTHIESEDDKSGTLIAYVTDSISSSYRWRPHRCAILTPGGYVELDAEVY